MAHSPNVVLLNEHPVDQALLRYFLSSRGIASSSLSPRARLETLEALGLVRHVHMGHGPGRYALTGRRSAEYVACERCGAHLALAPEALDAARAAVQEACGYRARFSHFPIVGTCPACAAEES